MADQTEETLPPAQFFNMMRIAHSPREFFIDLGQISTQAGVAVLIGRFATTPGHLKEMVTAISEDLARYEAKFGEIQPVRQETKQ